MHFADKLSEQVQKKQSPLCVGIDPHWDLLPKKFQKQRPKEALITFCSEIIESVSEYTAIVKVQLAFFEIFGAEGIDALEQICTFAQKRGLLVLADGKKNDIGSTAKAYAEAYLGAQKPYDALTVTPFLGIDGITPFLEKCVQNEKGIFVLVKTSNPSSGEFQDLAVGDELFHEHVARKVALWGENFVGESKLSSVGAVVGATYPDEIKLLRQDMPQQIFLVPGYGTQGGGAEDVQPAFYAGAKGAIINSSRGILFAYRQKNAPEDLFIECAKNAAEQAAKELWNVGSKM